MGVHGSIPWSRWGGYKRRQPRGGSIPSLLTQYEKGEGHEFRTEDPRNVPQRPGPRSDVAARDGNGDRPPGRREDSRTEGSRIAARLNKRPRERASRVCSSEGRVRRLAGGRGFES